MQKLFGSDEFIATTTVDSQSSAEITVLKDGSYVVTWISSSQGGTSSGIYTQRFGAGGIKQGQEYCISTNAIGSQKNTAIAQLSDGGYIVSWSESSLEGHGWGITAQRFTASGEPAGTAFLVNTVTSGDQKDPAILGLGDGGYVVTWNSVSPDGAHVGIYAQRFSNVDARIGGEVLVNTSSTGEKLSSSVISLTDGSYVIAWQSDLQDGDGTGVYFQRYAQDGTALAGETQINTTTTGNQYDVQLLALPDGHFVATWTSLNSDSDICVQRFTKSGVPAGEEIKITSAPGVNKSSSALTALPDGGYMVFWQSEPAGTTSSEIHAQRFGPSGAVIDPEISIATDASYGKYTPKVCALADGGFVVTWTSVPVNATQTGQDGSGLSVMAREFHPEAAILPLDSGTSLASSPKIALLKNGGYVVIWESSANDESSGINVHAQRFDAQGEPIGTANRIDTSAALDQYDASITGLADGGYLVVWSQEHIDHSFGVYSQRFDYLGQSVGDAVQVNTRSSLSTSDTKVIALASGGYAITWVRDTLYGAHDICTRLYQSGGAAVNLESTVNTNVAGSQLLPSMAALANGGYVVAWSDSGDYYASPMIKVQRYAANGSAIGSEVRIDSVPTYASNPSVAGLADGGFIVAFDDADGNKIYTRRYDQDGRPVASDIQIATPDTASLNREAQVVALPDGGYMVAWQRATTWPGDGHDWVTVAQRFDASGNTVGPEQQVSFSTQAQQGSTDLTASADGQLVAAWIESGSIGHGMVLPQTAGTRTNSNLVIGTNSAELLSGTVNPDIIHGLGGNDTLDGNQGIDTLIGGSGDDTYIVDNAHDVTTENTEEGTDLVQSSVSYVISANIENLTLLGTAAINATGNALANTLTGNTGSNTLDGAAGADTLAGGAGDDTYVFNRGSGQDTIRSEADTRTNRLESLRFGGTILPGDVRAQIVGTSLELSIENTTDKVTIESFYTDNNPLNPSNPIQQVIFSEGSVLWNLTTLVNLATASTITGSTGNDVLSGTAKADKVYGLAGNDVLSGLAGNDTLDGGTGSDKLVGGTGDDTYIVDVATDTVTELAGEGADLVQASLSWTLGANVENLRLTGAEALTGTGNALGNVITGNSGANLLDGQAGADTLIGGAGNDTYAVDNLGDVIVEAANEGVDLVQSTVSFTLANNVEQLILLGTALDATGNALGNVLTGNAGANMLDGKAGADTLVGGAGNDTYVVDSDADVVTEAVAQGTDLIRSSVSYTASANVENLTLLGELDLDATGNALANVLTGNSGANVLDGLSGADKLVGGAGDDTYVVDVAGDAVVELAGEGTDLVRASLSWTLGANVENLILTGATALKATGNTLANTLHGNAAANTLDGGAGADTLIGAEGDDTYIVDNIGDVVTERMGEGIDLIQSSTSYTVSANVEKLTLTGTAALNATGNDLANVLTGNSGANVLDGAAGADTLIGGAGNDSYVVDVAGDVVTEAAGQGTDLIRSAVTYTAPANVENLTLTGTGALDATGNTLANVLTGNEWNNTLDGKGGADQLIGGAGDDTYLVDTAGDLVTELAGQGTDLILSSVTYTTSANVENLSLTGTAALNATGNALANILTGNSGINTLSGGPGNDTLLAGAGNDVLKGGAGADLLTGGSGSDLFVFAAGDSTLDIAGITGFDTLSDFSLGWLTGAQDKIDTIGTPVVLANTTGFNGTDSTLTLAGLTIKSHAIAKGMVTFDDADTYASALTLGSMADVAAVVQYLQANDLGNAGASVAFDVNTGGLQHTFLFTQGDNAGSDALDLLVDLVGVNANGLTTSTSGVPADYLVIG